MFNELDDFLAQAQSDEEEPDDGIEEELEEDEELVEEDADVVEGRVCAVCGTEFKEGHGKAVVCKSCSDTNEGADYPVATHPEVNA